MHKPESVLEIEMHKNLCDFEIEMDYTIPDKRPDNISSDLLSGINKNKRTSQLVDFAVPTDHRMKLLVNKWILPFQQTIEWNN